MIVLPAARAILALVQPQTGTRAAGVVTAVAASSPVTLPMNSYLLPVVNGGIRPELVFKTTQGPNVDRSWTVTSGGTAVGVTSVLGGLRHVLAAGTVFRWDPPIAGLNPTATSSAGTAGGLDPTFFGGLKSAVFYDEMGGQSPTLDAFRARLSALPGLVLVWESSEPADGSVTDTTNRGTRLSRGQMFFTENFMAVVVANRPDGANARRSEALAALDEVTLWLHDRASVDHEVVSNPGGLQVRSRFRVPLGNRDAAQTVEMFGMRFAATRVYKMRDSRTYNDWLLTRVRVQATDPA